MDEIAEGDLISRWVFFPEDFDRGFDTDPLLNIKNTMPFAEDAGKRRRESANLSRLLPPYPDAIHALGQVKAAAKLEKYRQNGNDKPYTYKGFLEAQAGAITQIRVQDLHFEVFLEADDMPGPPNPAHVTIEMIVPAGMPNAKGARTAAKDLISRIFGTVLIEPE